MCEKAESRIILLIARPTRRLTRLQTMHNVLINSKTLYTCSCSTVAVNFSNYLCSVLYHIWISGSVFSGLLL